MDPVTLKMAANIALSLAKSKTLRRAVIVVVLLQTVVFSFVLFVPAYLMASVAPAMHQVATEQACTAAVGADSSVPLPAGAVGAELTVRMGTWNVLKSNSTPASSPVCRRWRRRRGRVVDRSEVHPVGAAAVDLRPGRHLRMARLFCRTGLR